MLEIRGQVELELVVGYQPALAVVQPRQAVHAHAAACGVAAAVKHRSIESKFSAFCETVKTLRDHP